MLFTDDYRKGYDEAKTKYEKESFFKKEYWGKADKQRSEIISIAKENNPDFDLSANISLYGKSDSAEFFAEVFANSQCGNPNELGDAMNEWLRRQGYDT